MLWYSLSYSFSDLPLVLLAVLLLAGEDPLHEQAAIGAWMWSTHVAACSARVAGVQAHKVLSN